jgi:hypothetical protein
MQRVRYFPIHLRSALSAVALAAVSAACSKEAPAFTNNSVPNQDQLDKSFDPQAADAAGRRGNGDSEDTGNRHGTEADSAVIIPDPEAVFNPDKKPAPKLGASADPDINPEINPERNDKGDKREKKEKIDKRETTDTGDKGNKDDVSNPVWIENDFKVRGTKTVDGDIFAEDRWISQPLQLSNIEDVGTLTFQQLTRPVLTETIKQGQGAQNNLEKFAQSQAAGVLDLLVVIDTSGSMSEEQVNLGSKLSPLITSVSNSDWHIGVVTTDPKDGCMRSLIKKSDSNSSAAFEKAVAAGITGTGNEQGIRQAVAGLSCPTADWLREASTVAVLIVSDEDNCSKNGQDCGKEPWNTDSYLLNFMQKDLGRKLGSDARVYGLIKHPSDTECKTASNVGTQYAAAIDASKGTWGSICASDYSNTLARISSDVATILKKQFALKTEPKSGTTEVTIILPDGTRQKTSAFTINGSVLTFTSAPPPQSQIEVSYQTETSAMYSEFEIASNAVQGSAMVSINNTQVAPDQYTLTGNRLRFVNTPPANATITATYRKDSGLNQAFELGQDVIPSSLSVSVNGTSASGVTFDSQTGKLAFAAAPADGATITAKFLRNRGPERSYRVLASSSSITEIRAQYNDNTEVKVSAKTQTDSAGQSNSSLEILPSSPFRAGETLWVQYRVNDQKAIDYSLGQEPLAGTLVLTSSLEECKVGRDINYVAGKIIVSCPTTKQLRVGYTFETPAEILRIFNVTGFKNSPAAALTVRVNGILLQSSQYDMNGDQLSIKPEVGLIGGDVIKVTTMTKAF